MGTDPRNLRLFAVNLRSASIGFALFEGSTMLLCWGTRSLSSEGSELAGTRRGRVASLLRSLHPQIVALNQALPKRNLDMERIAKSTRIIRGNH